MNNNILLQPCKKMLKDKLDINPPEQSILESIENAKKNISNGTPDYNKKILAYVYDNFKNNDTIENAVNQLENIRNMVIDTQTPIHSPTPNDISSSNPNIPFSNPTITHMYNTNNKTFKTHLCTLNHSNTSIKLPKNSKCFLYCIIANIIHEDILIINISNSTTKYKFHMYKESNIYKTINDIEPIIINNKDNFQIQICNFKNNPILLDNKQIVLERIQKIDNNHFQIVTSQNLNKHDVSINNHIFYYVEDNIYVTDSYIDNLTQFVNSKCIILSNNINIIFKY